MVIVVGNGNGNGDGAVSGAGDGYGYGAGDGYGYGAGDGNGYGDGDGYGAGYGNGDGYGDGDGDGAGAGAGDGYGYGAGAGYGYGAGYGDGDGNGAGYGAGYGNAVVGSDTPIIAYHCVPNDRKIRHQHGSARPKIEVGLVLEFLGKIRLCSSGLHASLDPEDARKYCNGIMTKVACSGNIILSRDKLVCSRREILDILG